MLGIGAMLELETLIIQDIVTLYADCIPYPHYVCRSGVGGRRNGHGLRVRFWKGKLRRLINVIIFEIRNRTDLTIWFSSVGFI